MSTAETAESPPATAAPQVAAIVEKYIQLRDRKAVLKREYEGKVEAIDVALDRCENYLLKHLQSVGAESIKTPAGTAYITTKTSASVADKQAFLDFVKEREEWSMLDVRANKTVVDEFKTSNNGALPPGVNWSALRSVNIRR
jgi:hypothetical protein